MSTSSQSEIFFIIVGSSIHWPFKPRRYIRADRTRNKIALQKSISFWEGVMVLKGQIHRTDYTITTFGENISLWEGVLVLKWKYTGETTVTKNILLREGALVLKCKYTEETTITKNISLWEGVHWC